jgi:hypothetical protein
MSDMRKLINLMEGVMSIPGLNEARFENVSCSQCGKAFGPGDSGYSHCSDHKGKTAVDESGEPDRESSMHPVNMIRNVISQLHPNDTSPEAVARELPTFAQDPQYANWHKQASDSFYGVAADNTGDEYDYTDDTMRRGEMGNSGIPMLEKSTSEKQARFMAAAAHDPKFAKKVGMDTSVAKEFNKADTGTKQLSNAMKNKEESCSMEESQVSDGQMSNPAPAVEVLAMESSDYDLNFIRQAINQHYDMATSEDELRRMVAGETGYGQNPEFNQMFDAELDHFLNGDDSGMGDGWRL